MCMLAALDVVLYGVEFEGMKLAGIILIAVGFFLVMFPDNWPDYIMRLLRYVEGTGWMLKLDVVTVDGPQLRLYLSFSLAWRSQLNETRQETCHYNKLDKEVIVHFDVMKHKSGSLHRLSGLLCTKVSVLPMKNVGSEVCYRLILFRYKETRQVQWFGNTFITRRYSSSPIEAML